MAIKIGHCKKANLLQTLNLNSKNQTNFDCFSLGQRVILYKKKVTFRHCFLPFFY